MTISNWQQSDATEPVETSIRSVERRRRLKPVAVALALVASMVVAVTLAMYYASTLPYPYGM